MRRIAALALAAALAMAVLSGATSAGAATPTPAYALVSVLPVGQALAVNSSHVVGGQDVVGTGFCLPPISYCTSYFFNYLWYGEERTLPRCGASDAQGGVTGINDRRWAIMNSGNPPIQQTDATACVWVNGQVLDLGGIRGAPRPSAWANGINQWGWIVGNALSPTGFAHPFLWANGVMYDLGTLPGSVSGDARAINVWGQVVGASGNDTGDAFLWHRGVTQNLGHLPGHSGSTANAINMWGHVAGVSWSSSVGLAYHATLWRHGQIIDLGSFDGPSGTSMAMGINSSEQVVGWSFSSAACCPGRNAFVWTRQTGMLDLNALIATDSQWFLEEANAINEEGAIIGRAVWLKDGSEHGFLLMPTHPNTPPIQPTRPPALTGLSRP